MEKQCCIFDLDGTLVDSMALWQGLGQEYLSDRDLSPGPEHWAVIKTLTMSQAAAYLREVFTLEDPVETIVADMRGIMAGHYGQDVPLKPGVEGYLHALRDRGAKLCVATATAEPLARSCLERLGVAHLFEAIHSCETAGVGKDQPHIYLLAAETLGAAPEDCAVFEDALYAAKTARRAGFYTVGVYEQTCAEDFPALKDLCHETVTQWGLP